MVEVKPVTEIIEGINPDSKAVEHKLVYDSSSEQLEPIYFYIIDLMEDQGVPPEKLVDNFVSSPGSGHFGELGQRASIMQQQAAQAMERINTIIRSVLNIVYDLRDFQTRLKTYDDLKSSDKAKKEGALLSLKQVWLDKVDMQKGNSSLKAMALGQAGFQTLLDAFLAAKDESLKDINGKELDLNDRVKRIAKQRLTEFNVWLKESESELRKRYNMQRAYLKSQVNSLKLYIRWAKPYLKAAQELEMSEHKRDPDLVKTFNTMILELTLLGKKKVGLPDELSGLKTRRNYYACVLVDFHFRSLPQRIPQQQSHYVFGGKTEVTFRGYALNEDELDELNKELEKSDLEDAFSLIEGATTESLENLKEEIEKFLEEPIDKEDEKNSKKENNKKDINPFLALIGWYDKDNSSSEKPKNKENKKPKKENWVEKTHLRPAAKQEAEDKTFLIFNIYKKSHGMPNYDK